jgi:hypothetical protein
MLVTLADPIKIPLSTNTTTRWQIRQQIITRNLTPHTKSILGRRYSQLLTDPYITQLNTDLTPLRHNQTTGLTSRLGNKMTWAVDLLAHTDVLQAYKEGLQEHELEEPPLTHTDKQSPNPPNPSKNKLDNQTTSKGKDKMPSMERQLPDPLKHMRRKHAADAKLLAS